MNKAVLGTSFLLALSPVVASAEGFYIGGSVGNSKVMVSSEDKAAVASAGGSVDDDDTGYKANVGYRFTPNYAVEAFYVDFGEASVTDGVDTGTVDADGVGARLLMMAPFGDGFDLYASLGFHSWDADFSSTNGFNASDDNTDVNYGLGLSYTYERVTFRGEFERFELDTEDVDLLTAGVTINF
ncbi:outer membrane beta-barrel protein [Pontibacterium sp. N1Y112]|uniref:Outer membrane beta-barrel protein n=1 Tax=Pontibacterium sinense TaxID=2781979 RepID=A0A8J7FL20_9GAMM|nr:outer membrane beta-barrel protein [Pontibacterium sinense]MBE9398188.1 outer membrane beta-barrel protein [Pontibacterium sinense]